MYALQEAGIKETSSFFIKKLKASSLHNIGMSMGDNCSSGQVQKESDVKQAHVGGHESSGRLWFSFKFAENTS